jgi:hypothetical protein
MENSENLGAAWRNEITPFLEELNLEVLNPCEFEAEHLKGLHIARLPEFFEHVDGRMVKTDHWHSLKNAKDKRLYDRFLKYMRRIIKYDITLIEHHTNYVIVKWDHETGKGAGTHAELTHAFMHNIPVYCVLKGDMPAWAKATCTKIFGSFDELKQYFIQQFGEL